MWSRWRELNEEIPSGAPPREKAIWDIRGNLRETSLRPVGSVTLPDGTITSNERDALVAWNPKFPNNILTSMSVDMLYSLLNQIEESLVEQCGRDEEELQDDPLIEQFDSLE